MKRLLLRQKPWPGRGCPGSIGGSQGEADFDEPSAELARDSHPGDVGYAAVYLASDEASWLTGQWLEIDGGASL